MTSAIKNFLAETLTHEKQPPAGKPAGGTGSQQVQLLPLGVVVIGREAAGVVHADACAAHDA